MEEEDPVHEIMARFGESFETLPNDVLIRIFSYVEKRHHFDLAVVCKHWLWLVSDNQFWKQICLSNVDLTEDRFQYFIKSRYIQLACDLSLSRCILNPGMLAHITERCPDVKNLSLKDCQFNFLPNDLDTLEEYGNMFFAKNMMRLDVRNFGKGFLLLHSLITNSSCENLECFGFGHSQSSFDCPQFNGFHNFVAKLSNLRVLECDNVNLMNDATIEVISSSMPNLEYVGLQRCLLVQGTTLDLLLLRCPKISSLILTSTKVDDRALLSVDWSRTIIDELDLAYCDGVTVNGLVHVLRGLPRLSYLRLDGCGIGRAFDDRLIDACISPNIFSNIETLSLMFTTSLGLGFKKLCNPLPDGSYRFLQLRNLSLRSCNELTPGLITYSMMVSMPNLRFFECGNMFDLLRPFSGDLFNRIDEQVSSEGLCQDLHSFLQNSLEVGDVLRVNGAARLLYIIARCNVFLEQLTIASRYYTAPFIMTKQSLEANTGEEGTVFRSFTKLLTYCQYLKRVDLPYTDEQTKQIMNQAIAHKKLCTHNASLYDVIVSDSKSSGIPKPNRSLDSEFNRIIFKNM